MSFDRIFLLNFANNFTTEFNIFFLLSLCLADTEFNICVKQNNLIGIVINTVFDMF